MKSTFMIAATGSGKGKTTFVTGLLQLLKDQGVHAFKCGPDYIDPMFHKEVLKIPSTNLDSFFCDETLLKKIFINNAGDINIIESAMGLYDGIGTSSRASAYETACNLNCPIVLLVDGYGMGYSIVPLIKGFINEDTNKLIKGVVINRISEKYYLKIAPVIEHEIGIKTFGYIPKINGVKFSSRHLGLLSPEENNFSEKIDLVADQIKRSVDIGEILKECRLDRTSIIKHGEDNTDNSHTVNKDLSDKVIAVARDEAFTFCYDENIKLLSELGANIKYFSPIHDKGIPEDSDVVIFYGGYPENYAMELSKNRSMLCSVRTLLERRIKIIAECGGFMYLLDTMKVDDTQYEMASVIHGSSYRTKGLVRFGYVNVNYKDGSMKAHEFHHFDTENVEYSDEFVVKNESSGVEYSGIVFDENILAGFPHMYYRSNPELIIDFIKG